MTVECFQGSISRFISGYKTFGRLVIPDLMAFAELVGILGLKDVVALKESGFHISDYFPCNYYGNYSCILSCW